MSQKGQVATNTDINFNFCFLRSVAIAGQSATGPVTISTWAMSANGRSVMGISQYDPVAKGRPAWNAGKRVGAKRALKVKQIWLIRFFLDREGRMRDRALFDLAIDSKLRGCDLVKMKIGSLVSGPAIRNRSMVIQQKTGRPVQFEITADTRASLLAWLERRGGSVDDFAFPSRVDPDGHLSTRQYARLVDEWVAAIGLRPEEYGTHSLRRTKAALIYKATGNLRAIQILLGHTKIENTVRYLGVDIDDALTLAETTEI
jgi:integrase